MANNTYGVVRPSLLNNINNDVEIWYSYKPTRNSDDGSKGIFKKIEVPSTVLKYAESENSLISTDNRLPGMYNMDLPVSIFGKKGFYTIYIKPKEFLCNITDIGSLSAYPDIRGIVVDLNNVIDKYMFEPDNLVGYRIEYFDVYENKLKRQEFERIITSNNYCSVVEDTTNSVYSGKKMYRYNNSGNLVFITVTPSTSPSFKSSSLPYIGSPSERICITNTKFDPVMIELEMCEHDIETLSIMAEGEQIRNLENGRVTTYNFDGEVYKQYEFSTIKDNYNKSSVIEAKLNKNDNIDYSIDLNEIKKS